MTTNFDAWIDLVGGALAGLEAAIKRVPHSSGCGIHAPAWICDCVGPHEPDCTTAGSRRVSRVSRECTCSRRDLLATFERTKADVRAGADAIPRSPSIARLLAAADAAVDVMSDPRPGFDVVRAMDELRAARKAVQE